jgi:hypothetical protein
MFQNLSNEAVLGLLLRAVTKHDIEIISVVFMPSYFEMLLRSKKMAIDACMRDFQGPLGKLLKAHWKEPIDRPFPERYESALVAQDSRVHAFISQLCLPTMEGYVEHPRAWPAVSGWASMMSGEPMRGKWVNRTRFWKLRQCDEYSHLTDEELIELVTEHYAVETTKLPDWEEMSDEKYRAEVREKVEARSAQIAEYRRSPYPEEGSEAWEQLMAQRRGARDMPIGLVVTSSLTVLMSFKRARKKANYRYDDAAERLRRGLDNAYFPRGMFPPGHRFCVGSAGAEKAGEDRGFPAEAKADTG